MQRYSEWRPQSTSLTAPTANLPSGGVNVIVLQEFDNDSNPLTPFGAGNAADLIASTITARGAGVFVYFNRSLDLPRLVYSTDLSISDSDLKVLPRMLNLTGQEGRNAMPTSVFSERQIGPRRQSPR